MYHTQGIVLLDVVKLMVALVGVGGGGQERLLLPRYSVYHTQGIVLLAATS